MRLATSDPSISGHGGPDYPSSVLAGGLPRCLHFQNLRRRPTHSTPASTSTAVRRRASNRKRSRRLDKFSSHDSYNSSFLSPSACLFQKQQHKLGNLQLAYLSAQVDSQCFQSLPPKIQQKFFSPEERAYLRQVYRESVILDAADHAVYRLEQKKEQTRPSCESLPSETTTTDLSQSSTLYIESSDSDWDTEAESDNEDDDDKMDSSLYDSFRRLDGDGDLDLRLDEHHTHVVNTVPSVSKQPPRRKPSFRRTMSFTASRHSRKATSSLSHSAVPATSQSSTVPSSLANIVSRNSTSRPPSGYQRPTMHAPRSSTSSIDPAAQYYQDPEARLKLRVYLASPQNFDEAIEFGFPSLSDGKDENPLSERPERVSECLASPKVQKLTGTFFEDENGSVHGNWNDKSRRKSSGLSTVVRAPQNLHNPPSSKNKRQSCMPASQPGLRRVPGNREMTLKMTLTRPDLREESSPSESPTSAEDLLKPEELPPVADSNPDIWESDSEQQNVMRKMWRKLRKPKY